jgi:hypothetical protein
MTNLRQTIGRYAGWLGLSLVLGMVAIAAYRSTPVSTGVAPVVRSTQATLPHPALQRVIDCLATHRSDQSLLVSGARSDPATRSTLDYIRAHQLADRPQCAAASWNQALRILLDDLRAHRR